MGGAREKNTLPDILTAMIEQIIDAVVVVDAENKVIFFNTAAEQFWQRRREDVLGSEVYRLAPRGLHASSKRYIDLQNIASVDELAGNTYEIELKRETQPPLWGAMTISKIALPPNPVAYMIVINDITEEVKRRDRLHLVSLVSDMANRAVVITDSNDRVVYINRAFTYLFGYREEEAIGQVPSDFLAGPKTDLERMEQYRATGRERRRFDADVIFYTKSGKEIWISASVKPVFDDLGNLTNWIGVHSNIHASRQLLRLQHDVLDAVASHGSLNEIMYLICQRVEAMDENVACSILSVDEQSRLHTLAAPSLPDRLLDAYEGVEIGPNIGTCGTAAYLGKPVHTLDITTDPNWDMVRDRVLPLEFRSCWSQPVKMLDGRVAGTFAFYFRKVTEPSAWHRQIVEACINLCSLAFERQETRSQLAQLAHYDALTGLPNRSLLVQHVGQAISSAKWIGRPFAVLYLNLDGFKHINKSLGYGAGDGLLIQVAHRIQEYSGEDEVIGRLGGDEFAVILPGADAHRAALFAEGLLEKLAEPLTIDGTDFVISASIGIGIYPKDGKTAEDLLQHADAAMAEAKKAGRRTYRFSNQEFSEVSRERLVLETALRSAISEKRLHLHYQPQIRLDSGALYGVEALTRWDDPVLGTVSPDSFIPLAEATGLIEELGFWSLRAACGQLAEWRSRSLAVPQMSVNLSALHFRNSALPGRIAGILQETGVSPEFLMLEITESVMIDRAPEVSASLQAIQKMGVRLSIDDFGTGYSSLSSLTRLPVHELKIDQTFIKNVDTDFSARTIVSAVVGMGRSLNLMVVAEGVETLTQAEFLRSRSCDVGQGYLFSRPQSQQDFEQWLVARARPRQN
ncbi:MAG: EAL domain-containing protein [Phyllobacterium sp.]